MTLTDEAGRRVQQLRSPRTRVLVIWLLEAFSADTMRWSVSRSGQSAAAANGPRRPHIPRVRLP